MRLCGLASPTQLNLRQKLGTYRRPGMDRLLQARPVGDVDTVSFLAASSLHSGDWLMGLEVRFNTIKHIYCKVNSAY